MLIFGDVRHTASQPYNYESGSGANGLFPRPDDQLAGMKAYAAFFRSYCVESDPICAGGDTATNHLNYFDIYSGSAGKWVQEVVGAQTTSSSTKSSATSTKVSSTSASASASATTEITSAAPTTEAASTGGSTPAPTSDNAAASSTPTGASAAGALDYNKMLLGLAVVAGLMMAC